MDKIGKQINMHIEIQQKDHNNSKNILQRILPDTYFASSSNLICKR